MFYSYPAIFMEEDVGYTVLFPDLDYLASQGDDMNDATNMAMDCLAGYIYDCLEDNEKFNKPSKVEEVDLDRYCKEFETTKDKCLIKMIDVDVHEYARKHFSI